jgi:hypothetical protein
MASALPQFSLAPPSSSPFDRVCDPATLAAAWDHVRRAAARSVSQAVRDEARRFEAGAEDRLACIADEIREGRFAFAPARGVARPRPGKPARPIVVAPVESRVVARALVAVLADTPAVADACLRVPTSFGGVPGRGVEQAVGAAVAAVGAGASFYAASDVAEFFRALPRRRALAEIDRLTQDARLAAILEDATRTEIDNLAALGDDARLFPGEEEGVAQGSSLSTLLGNVLLRGFDEAMNGRGIVCLRYVDDFLVLGPRAPHVRKAFSSAQRILGELGLRAYDPAREPGKAAMGHTAGGLAWLGCEIAGGRARPSARSRAALIERVERLLRDRGREAGIGEAIRAVEDAVRGFEGAYRFCDCPEVFHALDDRIGRLVDAAVREHRPRLCSTRPRATKRFAASA